jgi:soluble lytic murein transglycosylase
VTRAALTALFLGASLAGCGTARSRRPAPAPPPVAADTSARVEPGRPTAPPPSRRDLRAVAGRFGIPVAGTDGEVRWEPQTRWVDPRGPLAALATQSDREPRTARDSLRIWRVAAADTTLRPLALARMATLQLALGDSAGADSAWRALAPGPGLWAWDAWRGRADLAAARGAFARADSLLESADRTEWPDVERSAWLWRRIELRLALADSATALEFARQMLRRYPGFWLAGRAARLLEDATAGKGGLTREEERAAAEAELTRGLRAPAARRLERLLARTPSDERWRVALKLAEVRRQLGESQAASRALTLAERGAPHAAARSLVLLERARAHRAAERTAAATHAYDQAAAAAAGDSAGRDAAWWEGARLREAAGEWGAARERYARLADRGVERREAGAFRAGLMSLIRGDVAAAVRWWERSETEPFRFWRGVALRRSDRAAGDSLLRTIARLPGYGFYRCAARDTLGERGWPAPASGLAPAMGEGMVRLAEALSIAGLTYEALAVLERWTARRDANAKPSGPRERAESWLGAAAVAYGAGAPRHAIRYAERAAWAVADSLPAERWLATLWLYPPAFDSLLSPWPERATGQPDRRLLQALVWKESKFDPNARSRSNAIGLMQLKRAAATDVARWLGEAVPSEAELMNPALNVRYGARYLTRLLERFGGVVPLALGGYNAGAREAQRWQGVRAAGGDALVCEVVDLAETNDYVKSVLATRQAYRELRPTASR